MHSTPRLEPHYLRPTISREPQTLQRSINKVVDGSWELVQMKNHKVVKWSGVVTSLVRVVSGLCSQQLYGQLVVCSQLVQLVVCSQWFGQLVVVWAASCLQLVSVVSVINSCMRSQQLRLVEQLVGVVSSCMGSEGSQQLYGQWVQLVVVRAAICMCSQQFVVSQCSQLFVVICLSSQ